MISMMSFTSEEEENKLEKLYEEYRNGIFHLCNRIIRDVQEAEDAVQISFYKISRILHRIDDIYSKETKALIITIARNTALDIYRKRKKLPLPIEEMPVAFEVDKIEGGFIDRGNYEVLIDTINSMPEKYKDVLRLRCMYHLTTEETANILEISPNNVNARLCRARKLLLDKLEGSVNDE